MLRCKNTHSREANRGNLSCAECRRPFIRLIQIPTKVFPVFPPAQIKCLEDYFHFLINLSHSVKYCGRCSLPLIVSGANYASQSHSHTTVGRLILEIAVQPEIYSFRVSTSLSMP